MYAGKQSGGQTARQASVKEAAHQADRQTERRKKPAFRRATSTSFKSTRTTRTQTTAQRQAISS